jgi:hypothetical protein
MEMMKKEESATYMRKGALYNVPDATRSSRRRLTRAAASNSGEERPTVTGVSESMR